MCLAARNHITATVFLSALIAVACQTRPTRLSPTLPDLQGHDLVSSALQVELIPVSGKQRGQLVRVIEALARAIRVGLPKRPTAKVTFDALQRRFFTEQGFSASNDPFSPEATSIAATLQNRRGTCVGLAIIYVALAQRLGLDAKAVATPVHIFVRVRVEGRPRNVELLEGGEGLTDDTYRRRYSIDDASISAGAFMAELSNAELIAHLQSNQAVALSKQGKLDAAIALYDEALRLHPKLVAAWYNRGIDQMNSGLVRDALQSFNRAIELYPSDAQAHNNRGLAKVKLGDTDGARVDFTRALELQPDLLEAQENLNHVDSLAGKDR